MYIGGLWEGISPKKKQMFFFWFFPWPPLPLREAIYIYTHTLCLFFLLPFPRGSSWLSGHSLVTFNNLPSGRGYVHRRAIRGDKPEKKKTNVCCFFSFFPWPPLPLREAIYIYIHTHYVCFFSFLFPGNLHDSLDILWQPLRKSDNLCGSLAIPSQVYEHKGLNMM